MVIFFINPYKIRLELGYRSHILGCFSGIAENILGLLKVFS